MTPSPRLLAVAAPPLLVALVAGLGMTMTLHAEDLSRYRSFVLGSDVAEVVASAGARAQELKTQHERPSVIQTLEWRPPYTHRDSGDADPVDTVTFAFVDGQLYQISVAYDRARLAALTTEDLIAAVATVYGAPAPGSSSRTVRANSGVEGSVVLGGWSDAGATVTLVRGPFEDVQLILRSTSLGPLAAGGIEAAKALDTAEAPARRAAAEASAAEAQRAARVRNRSAFKP